MQADDVRKAALDCIRDCDVWNAASSGKDAVKIAFYIDGIRTMADAVCEMLEQENRGEKNQVGF